MIKLELNSTDELALRHMGNALTAMASEIESEHSRVKEANFILATGDKDSVKSEHQDRRFYVEEVTDEEVTEMIQDIIEENGDECKVDDPLDSNGLPWDGRIHSSSKAKIKDGSWRNRKGVDAETLATVEAELRALMAIPAINVEPEELLKQCEEFEPSHEDEVKQLSPELATTILQGGSQDVIVPPAPETIVPKPQGVTPPPPPVDAAPVGCTQGDVEVVSEPTGWNYRDISFAEITRYITGTMVKERGWKIPEVNSLLTEQYGVTFQTLKAREDLYDTVFNFLKEQPSK